MRCPLGNYYCISGASLDVGGLRQNDIPHGKVAKYATKFLVNSGGTIDRAIALTYCQVLACNVRCVKA
jgi:hypothetical protein